MSKPFDLKFIPFSALHISELNMRHALAIETSIIENVARLAPTEMEQYEAFKVLSDKGQSVDDIAAVFGITANSVKRRLALGALIPDVREAYSNQQIDAASIRVLTMATEERQAEWLALFNSDDYCPTGHQIHHPKEQGGRVYIETRESGEVLFHEGYITDKEAQTIRRALSNGQSESGKASKTSKPEMSGPMSDYMNLHRHSIARA